MQHDVALDPPHDVGPDDALLLLVPRAGLRQEVLPQRLEGHLAEIRVVVLQADPASVGSQSGGTINLTAAVFDADNNLYRWRYATANYGDYYWRPAHPFILIIIRPLVGILAFLFRGDTLFAAMTLNELTGAVCIFLVWYFVKHSVGNPLYALLIDLRSFRESRLSPGRPGAGAPTHRAARPQPQTR